MYLEDLEVQQQPQPLLLLLLQRQLLHHGKLVAVQEDQAVVQEIHSAWVMGVALEDLEVVVHTSNIINNKVTSLRHCSISNKVRPHQEVALMEAVAVVIVLHNTNNSNTTAHQHLEAVVLQPLYLMVVDRALQIASTEVAVDHLMVVVVEHRCHLDLHLQSVLVVEDSAVVAPEAIDPDLVLRPRNNHHLAVSNFMGVVVVVPCLQVHRLVSNNK